MDLDNLPRRLGQSITARAAGRDYHEVLAALVEAVNEHDTYTAGHSCRVSDYAADLGRVMGYTRAEISFMRQAGLVHDIGKIGIPENVLKKSEPLTEDELYLIRLHPILGASILSHFDGMEQLIPVVLHHHERWDGSGYPTGLRTVDIPREARMIFVADAFDAMTTDRPYGQVLTTEQALTELRRCSGEQFDPALVDAMHEAYHAGLLEASTHRTHEIVTI